MSFSESITRYPGDQPWDETATRPQWFVVVSFGTGPFAAPTFEAIEDVVGVSVSRGRQQVLDVFQPGTATVVVDGTSRALDPTYAAGAHYGELLPNKRLSIVAVYGNSGVSCFSPPELPSWVRCSTLVGTGFVAANGFALDMEVTCDWDAPAEAVMLGGRLSDGNDVSFIVGVSATTGYLAIAWTTDGTFGTLTSAESTVAPGWADGETHTIRISIDPDTGSGREIKFYELTDAGETATQIGATVTGAATTIYEGPKYVYFGGIPLFLYEHTVGVRWARIWTDPDATSIYSEGRFTNGRYFPPGAESAIDAYGRIWEVGGTAYLAGAVIRTFTGFVEGWPVPARDLSRVSIQATDGFGLLSDVGLPSESPLEAVLAGLNPRHWWRLDEPAGSTAVADSGSSPITGAPNATAYAGLGSAGLDPGSSVTAWANASGGTIDVAPGETFSSFACLLKRSAMGTGDEYLYNEGTGDWTVMVRGSASGYTGQIQVSDSTTGQRTSSVTVDDGAAHLIVVRRLGAGNFQIWVDGTLATSTTIAGVTIGASGEAALGSDCDPAGSGSFQGTLQHITLWTRWLSNAEIATIADAFDSWSGDTTDDRVGRLLDLAGWSSSDRELDASDIAPLESFVAADSSVLDEIRLLEATEGGRFYQDPSGKMVFRSRYSLVTDDRSTEVQYLFSDVDDDAVRGRFRFSDIVLSPQLEWIKNRVTVSYVGGQITVEDADSVAAYGVRSHQVETVLPNSPRARTLATVILQRYAEPILRIERLVLDVEADPKLWEPVLNVKIGDRIRVQWTPDGTGAQIEEDLIVDGLSFSSGPGVAGKAELWLASAELVATGPDEDYNPPPEDAWQWDVSLWGTTTIWA